MTKKKKLAGEQDGISCHSGKIRPLIQFQVQFPIWFMDSDTTGP